MFHFDNKNDWGSNTSRYRRITGEGSSGKLLIVQLYQNDDQAQFYFLAAVTLNLSGFGNMLAFGTQVRGFKPGRSRRIFQGEKILREPSFRREVRPFVPCRRFTTCKRSLNVTWKSQLSVEITGHFSPKYFLLSLLGSLVETPGGAKRNY